MDEQVQTFKLALACSGDSGSIIMTVTETQFHYRKENIEYLQFIQQSFLVSEGFMDVCTFYKYTIMSCTASKKTPKCSMIDNAFFHFKSLLSLSIIFFLSSCFFSIALFIHSALFSRMVTGGGSFGSLTAIRFQVNDPNDQTATLNWGGK